MVRGTASSMGLLLLAGWVCPIEGSAQETQVAAHHASKATATIINAKGKQIGTADLVQVPNGVLIKAQVSGLDPGEHAFHIHQNGRCEPPGFASAGDHFNPTNQEHGMEVATGPHAGDLPNIIVMADRSGRISALNPYVTLEKGKKNSLLKAGGTALIIHQNGDDYQSQPSGGGGDKVACGEIRGE